MVVGVISNKLLEFYNNAFGSMPDFVQRFVLLFFLVAVIVVYSIFIWKFHKFISSKNLIGIDFQKYRKSGPGSFNLLINGVIYFLEYIVVLPFLIFFWFSLFTIFLLILNEGLDTSSVLLVSATIVAAIRVMAYYKQDIADNLANMLPSLLIVVSILNPKFFSMERIIAQINEFPVLISDIMIYFVFIIILEIILRFFDLIFLWLGIITISEEKEDN